jgi:hypothetical protein
MAEQKDVIVAHQFIEEAASVVSYYAVGLVKLEANTMPQDALLAESGTLVEIDRTYAILTADHVIESLPKTGELGLILPTLPPAQLHRLTIPMKLIEKFCVARGANESDGPDLALLILRQSHLGIIKAIKSFYNLPKRCNRVLENPPPINVGFWVLSGMAHEATVDVPPEGGFGRVKVFRGYYGEGVVEAEYLANGYDFLEFKAKYNETYEGPGSFQGFSGGGLWHLLISKSEDGKLLVTDEILSGVAFYQSPIEKHMRTIKCNGRLSIYKNVIDLIKRWAS